MSIRTIGLPTRALVRRELLTSLRRHRTFSLFGLVMLGCIIYYSSLFSTINNFMQLRQVGTMLFVGFSATLYGIATIILPLTGAVSISSEKQQRSFDLLAMTYLGANGILLGKLINGLGIFFLMFLGLMPLVGVQFFFVGIDTWQFLTTLSLLLLYAIIFTLIGLNMSARFFRPLPALMFTIIAVGILNFWTFSIVIMEEVFNLRWVNLLEIEEFLIATIPWLVVVPDVPLANSSPEFVFILRTIYCGVIILLLYLDTLRILRKPPKPMKVDTREIIDDTKVLEERKKSFPFYLIDPLRRKQLIPDNQNPMYFKERYSSLFTRGTVMIRVFYISTAATFFLSLPLILDNPYNWNSRGFVGGSLTIPFIALIAILPPLISSLVSKEFELKNIDMLQMTLVSPAEIITGKLRTALYMLQAPLLGIFIGMIPWCIFMLRSINAWLEMGATLIVSGVCVAFSIYLCLAISLATRRTIISIVGSYVALLFVFVLNVAILLFFGAIIHRYLPRYSMLYYTFDSLGETIFVLSPYAAYFNFLDYRGGSMFNLSLCIVSLIAFIAFTFGLHRLCIYLYNRAVRQAG